MPEATPSNPDRFRYKRPVIAGLAASAAIAGFAVADRNRGPKAEAASATPCAEQVSPQDRATVERMIDGPPIGFKQRRTYGLHPHLQESDNLAGALINSEAPFSTYLKYTREIFNKYGIRIVFRKPGDNNIGEPLTQQDLNTPIAKGNLLYLMSGVAQLPEEYTRYAGVRKFLLLKGLPKKPVNISAETRFPNSNNDTIAFDMTKQQTPQIVDHEVEHYFDLKVCGEQGSLDDPQFAALNKDPDIYGTSQSQSKFLFGEHQADAKRKKLQSDALVALYEGNNDKYKQLMQAYRHASAEVVSLRGYGISEVVEDKAVDAEYFGSTNLRDQLDLALQQLEAKTELELDRIYAVEPRVARYFIEVARLKLN
jgi:hypothetical protein